jgi:hypothetical protein
MDRAQSEQQNMLMALRENERINSKWFQAAGESLPILKNLMKSMNNIFKKAIDEIQAFEHSFHLLLKSLMMSERARIQIPSSFGTNSYSPQPAVSPLDVVSRGFLGEEMASLINALRISGKELSQLSERVSLLRKQITEEITDNISRSLQECCQKYSELI